MTTPSRAVPALRLIPRESAYHVELSPTEVLARVESDPEVQRVAGFPARGRSDRKFLVERTSRGFRVCQNLASGAVDTGPAVLRRLTLEAELHVTPRGTLVRARFARGPLSRQASFYIMWAASFAWLGLTGITAAKVGLIAAFLVLTVPAFIYDLLRAAGSDDDRVQLLNLLSQLLGPTLIGDNPEENMPYRHGHRLPEPITTTGLPPRQPQRPARGADDDDDDE